MRRDTKLAIVIGLIVVGFGAWYITLPDVSEPSDTAAIPADKADSSLAEDSRPDKAFDGASAKSGRVGRPFTSREAKVPGRPGSAQQPDLAKSADRPRTRRRGGLDPAKVDAQRSGRLALPRSLGQATSRPAGVAVVGAVATRPAGVGKKPKLAKRRAPQKKPQEKYKLHVIRSGDTYSALAQKYLGSAKHASLLAKANPGIHPRRLMIGAKIKIPNLPVKSNVAPGKSSVGVSVAASPVHRLMAEQPPIPSVPKDRAYTIKDGEGWSALSERFLGEGSRWPELYELNRERVPRNPNILPAGTVIEVPKSVKNR